MAHTEFTDEDNNIASGNNTFTGTNTFSGPLVLTGTDSGVQTISGAKTFTGQSTFGNSAFFKGPEPWADVTQYGLVGDGVTDNTAAFNALIVLASVASNNIHTIYFPITAAGKYRFASKPNAIGIEAVIVCGNRPVQWNPTGVDAAQLMADYNEATAANAFLDFSGSTSPGNSGIVGCQLWKGTGKTGGTAIKYEGTSTTQRAGGGPIEDVRVSGDGTWDWGLRVDCTNITTAGSQGCRDLAIRNLDIFQTTTGCASFNNAIHLKWVQGGCFPTAGVPNSHVDVTGTAVANTNSTNVEFVGVEILDTLALDWVTNFVCSACYATNLSASVNTKGSFFSGVSANTPSIAGQLAYLTFDSVSPNGYGTALTNSIHATNFISSGTAPANVGTGDLCASFGTTGGNMKFGSDGQMILRRNNGSGSGTNLAITFDAFGTTPYQFDTANGFSSTVPIYSSTAGGTTLGKLANPFSSAFIGGAATNNIQVTGTATAARVATLQDQTGTIVVRGGSTSQKAESAADANVLTFTPLAQVGTYRLHFVLSLSAANAATLGWTATWTDSNGNAQTPTNLALSQTGVAAPALTFTTSAAGNYYGDAIIDTNNAGTNIVIKLTFAGTSFTGKASATVERII